MTELQAPVADSAGSNPHRKKDYSDTCYFYIDILKLIN